MSALLRPVRLLCASLKLLLVQLLLLKIVGLWLLLALLPLLALLRLWFKTILLKEHANLALQDFTLEN